MTTFVIERLTKYYSSDQIKGDEFVGSRGMHGREEKCVEVVFGKHGGKRTNIEIDVEEI